MKRKFTKTLLKWKANLARTPLIVRGSRQVGKTYVIQEFGKQEFKNCLTINFEASEVFRACFEAMDPVSIISQIELIANQKVTPGETLLFLDEIQQCPNALRSLRYFKEKMPALHVIAAGSLLEFAINNDQFSFPVGRVQFARMYPFSFEEYLEARNEKALLDALNSFDVSSPPSQAVHLRLMELVKEYFIVGGMPAAILAYINTAKFLEAKYVQKSLWDAFEVDFGKYAKKMQHRPLKKIFQEVPRILGSHVKYSRIDPDMPNPAREIKQAMELLELAGLLHYIYATSAGSIPLLSGLKESIFKLIFLDIGLVGQAMNVDPAFPGLMTGPLAEQFVGQELLSDADPLLDEKLFFWNRDKSDAEVDYLFAHNGKIYPVEVKAGRSGKLKSLYVFMKDKKAAFGIKISQDSLCFEKDILSVPFYLTAHLARLIDFSRFKRQGGELTFHGKLMAKFTKNGDFL